MFIIMYLFKYVHSLDYMALKGLLQITGFRKRTEGKRRVNAHSQQHLQFEGKKLLNWGQYTT